VRAVVAFLLVTAATASPAFSLRSEQTLPFAFNQGAARVDGGWLFSGTDSPVPGSDVLERTDDALDVLTVQPVPIPLSYRNQGYDHVGDIDVAKGVLYVPFEQPNYDLGHQVTARYDPTTLAFIDAIELPQHENSFVSVDPVSMIAYTMDHFDGDSVLRYDVQAGWKVLPPLPLTMTLHHTQGGDVADGALWISTSDDHNGVYRVDLASGVTTSVGTLGHQGLEGEGIDATALPSGAFHALVNDPLGAFVYFGHYDLVDSGAADSGAATADAAASRPLATTGGDGRRWLVCGALLIAIAGCAWRARRWAS